MMKEISEAKLAHYFDVTKKALRKAKHACPPRTHLRTIAEDFLDMSERYYKDAHYFFKKGDYVNAFAALNYAHGWLDAGARLGIFNVKHDSRLFTVD